MTNSITSTGVPHSKEVDPKIKAEMRKASREFESFFLLHLWRTMQATVPNQTQSLNYTEMFDMSFADYLSQSGNFNLGEMIYQQLDRQVASEGSETIENRLEGWKNGW
jgi:Rod binding domain-containing protein